MKIVSLIKRVDSWGEWYEVETADKTEIYMGVKMIDGLLYAVNGEYIAYQSEYQFADVMYKLEAVDHANINDLFLNQFGVKFSSYPVFNSCDGLGR